jgi:Tfp pilus assembly protein PilO
MNKLHLKDIKPNVPIIDWQWYVFLIFMIILIIGILFLIYKFIKHRKKEDLRKKALKELKELDFKNSKKTAYKFTKLAHMFVNEENKTEYEKIVKKLEKYKYKPEVPDMDEEIIKEIKEFIREIK